MSKNKHAQWGRLGPKSLLQACIILSLVTLATFSNTAFARVTIEGVRVLTEEESPDDLACGLRAPAVTAAIESTLRSNRIPVLSDSEMLGHIRAYANFTSIDLGSECAVSYSLEFNYYGFLPYRESGKEFFGALNLCTRGGLLKTSRAGLQEKVLTKMRSYTEQCISETERADE